MPFHFCPQCGTKLQPDFKFCPSCGEKLPCSADEPGVGSSAAPLKDEATTAVINTSPAAKVPSKDGKSPISPRPALRNTRNTLQLQKNVKFNIQGASPSSSPDTTEAMSVGSQTSPTSPISHTVRANLELKPTSEASSPPAVKSPRPGGGSKAKKAKHASLLEPLQEGEELTDKTGKKWKLVKLIGQSPTDLLYEVAQPRSKEADHVLKLGAKDGKIFTEQNFLQRAAKSASVEKWIKQNKMDFLGIPNCVGFGLHADSYRFLVFPNMGSSLQSVMEEGNKLLSEEAVLQLACRLLDVLEFIHSNEYVHADINAENVYIKAGQRSQVYLVGYCHAVRYCPGGQHVEYRENSRMPHEGAIELISLDAHNGAAPSRRSDLQSLGYCMLMWHTGTLPWLDLAQPEQVATQKRRYVDDVKALLSFCFGKRKVPGAFQSFLTAVMALQYDEEPNYSELKAELSAALQQLGGSVDQPLNISM
uniref:VRK serine/threonine kinase 3 n=1 Tax=Fundulus heteroclitus TaxID=8078 RepID=A0A3Q2QK17_FUNHE